MTAIALVAHSIKDRLTLEYSLHAILVRTNQSFLTVYFGLGFTPGLEYM